MGRKKAPSEAVLMDSTNCAASAKTNVEEHSSPGQGAESILPVTFSRKAKVCLPLATMLHSFMRP